MESDGSPDTDGTCDTEKPIVSYPENTIPERYRQPMMEAIETWSLAFEEAVFRDSVRAVNTPNTAGAGDIRYPILRWYEKECC